MVANVLIRYTQGDEMLDGWGKGRMDKSGFLKQEDKENKSGREQKQRVCNPSNALD